MTDGTDAMVANDNTLTLRDVEDRMLALMNQAAGRSGLSIEAWVKERLHNAAIAALATRPDPSVELMEAARQTEAWGYLWKWVERGMFDKSIGPYEALEVLAHHPSAPWKNGRWNVDHKPYAAKFYEAFPNARGEGL